MVDKEPAQVFEKTTGKHNSAGNNVEETFPLCMFFEYTSTGYNGAELYPLSTEVIALDSEQVGLSIPLGPMT
jgi:hypothetical protein